MSILSSAQSSNLKNPSSDESFKLEGYVAVRWNTIFGDLVNLEQQVSDLGVQIVDDQVTYFEVSQDV